MYNNLLAGAGLPAEGTINNNLLKGTALETMAQIVGVDPASAINTLLPKFIGLLLVFGVVAFFFMLLWGAVSWIISGGDKAHIESAKARITSALIGLVLMLSTFAIIKLIETFFGIDILSIDIGPLVIQ